jgi:outer membrane protein TolC
MTRKTYVWLLLVACMAWPFTAFAESSQPQTIRLSLTEAMRIAASENPAIIAAGFKVESSQAGVTQARSGFLPRVDFVETYNRTTNPMWVFGAKLNQESITTADFNPDLLNDPDAYDDFSTALTMSWPVFAGGKIYNRFRQAETNALAEKLVLKRTRQEVIARAAIAYVGMMLAGEQLKVVNQSIASARANLKMVQAAYDSGLSVKSDLLRSQVTLADLEQQRLQAESRVRTAQAGLNAAMGRPVETPLDLTSEFEKCCVLSGDIDHWTEIALLHRYDLQRMNCMETMAEQGVAISRADHFPSLRLMGSYDIHSEDFDDTANSYTVGAVMSVNLFSGFGISSGVSSARADLNNVRQMIRNMELGIRVEIQSAFLEAQSALKRISVAGAALDQADEGLRIVKNRYQNGLLTIVGLLDAELANQQAKMSYSKSLHDYKTAMIKLELAAGIIDENSNYDDPARDPGKTASAMVENKDGN